MSESVLSEGWADGMTKPMTWTPEEKHWREHFPVELGYGAVGIKTAAISSGQCVVHPCQRQAMPAYILCWKCLAPLLEALNLDWLPVYRRQIPLRSK